MAEDLPHGPGGPQGSGQWSHSGEENWGGLKNQEGLPRREGGRGVRARGGGGRGTSVFAELWGDR